MEGINSWQIVAYGNTIEAAIITGRHTANIQAIYRTISVTVFNPCLIGLDISTIKEGQMPLCLLSKIQAVLYSSRCCTNCFCWLSSYINQCCRHTVRIQTIGCLSNELRGRTLGLFCCAKGHLIYNIR